MGDDTEKMLLDAARDGDLDIVQAALIAGAPIDAKAQFGDTALNLAAEFGHLAVVEHLLEAGADVQNVGGADKTPVMNAAFSGNLEIVKLLLDKGAKITNDLLSSVQMKVRIFAEQADSGFVRPEAVSAWKGFLDYLVGQRMAQDLPEMIEALSADDADRRKQAAEGVKEAAKRGVDITDAVEGLNALTDDANDDTQYHAAYALSVHHARAGNLEPVGELLGNDDKDVLEGAISVLSRAIQSGADPSALVPRLVTLMQGEVMNLRHDAAMALGHAATNEVDVGAQVPDLIALLSDEAAPVRKIAAWSLYRVAKHVCDIGPAVETLQGLAKDDPEQEVREMAAETLQMQEQRQG